MEFQYTIESDGSKILTKVIDPDPEIILPKDIKKVRAQAFLKSTVIEMIEFPDGITDLPETVFSGLKSLKTVILPKNLTHIAKMFQYTPAIETVRLPDAIKEIPNGAFFDCEELKAIVIPKNVTTIGEHAFENCRSLKRVTMFAHVKNISYCAFYNSGLETVTIPRSVTDVDGLAFADCRSLKKAVLLEGVSGLNGVCFSGCKNMTEVFLPESLSSIGGGCFNNCPSLTIRTPKDYWLKFDGQALLRTEPPKSFLSFTDNASSDHYTMPEGPENVSGLAFYLADIREVFLADSVKQVRKNAFYSCRNLLCVRFPAGIEEVDEEAFNNCPRLKYFEVPEDVKESAPDVIKVLEAIRGTCIRYLNN